MGSVHSGMASLEFDKEACALYVRLKEGKPARSEPVGESVILDLDERGELLGIEVLLPPDMDEELKEGLARASSRTRRAPAPRQCLPL